MTQVEQILYELDKSGDRGLLSSELQERTDIAAGTLRTTLYDLKKRELIRKASGSRGSYRYAVTQKGRAELHAKQPLLRDGYAPASRELSNREEQLENTLRLVDRLDEYKLLRQFTSFLLYESKLRLEECEGAGKEALSKEVLRFMGVDPENIENISEELYSLATSLRGTL